MSLVERAFVSPGEAAARRIPPDLGAALRIGQRTVSETGAAVTVRITRQIIVRVGMSADYSTDLAVAVRSARQIVRRAGLRVGIGLFCPVAFQTTGEDVPGAVYKPVPGLVIQACPLTANILSFDHLGQSANEQVYGLHCLGPYGFGPRREIHDAGLLSRSRSASCARWPSC